MEDTTNVRSSQRRDGREPAREGQRFSDLNQLDGTHPGDSNTDGEADATALLQQLSIINSKLEEERLQAITIQYVLELRFQRRKLASSRTHQPWIVSLTQ